MLSDTPLILMLHAARRPPSAPRPRASSFGSQDSGNGDAADSVVPLEAPFDMANPLTKPPQQSVAAFTPASLARVASARMQSLPRAPADALDPSSALVSGSNPMYTPLDNAPSARLIPVDPVPFVGANPMYSPSDEGSSRGRGVGAQAVARPSLQLSPAPPGLKRGTSVRYGTLGAEKEGDGDDKRRGWHSP